MSRSSEEVLLVINSVRNKKTDGMLYMMGERMAWMQSSKNSFSYSHPYADIKSQKISPDTKEKVQLQVVMHNGSANTFHFNNPEGRTAQMQDRDAVKELLQQLLPKFRRKLSSELEEKNRLLKENPELFQLYKDLVVTQVITADEFWATQANKYANGGEKGEQKQQTGVSAAFLADIKPQTDGCNGLKYNLTADIIESIFRTYPMGFFYFTAGEHTKGDKAVMHIKSENFRKKHAEYVPHEMTESDFWTRFFQSHYFHRDRTTLGSKDIFSECAKKDEDDIKEEMDKNVKDPLLDLTQITDSTLDEGYGGTTEDKRISHNQTNLTMIRRFNYHSTMVLKACETNKGQQESHKSDSSTNSSEQIGNPSPMMNGEASSSSNTEQSEPVTKKARIREKLEMEDFQDEEKEKSLNLQLSRMERYLHGPTPVMAVRYTTGEDMMQATHSVATEISHWTPNLTQVIPENVALSVLGELSPGGALMHGTSQQQLHQMVSPNIQEELKQQYNALCELLRHFWTCFPTSTKFLEEKVVRMKSTLERFQMAKLNPLKDKLEEDHYSIDLTGHMEEMLAAVYRKFDTWQSKRMQKKS